jgi:hypothetical protein
LYKIFGIRHHGPGSTQSLIQALEAMQPDCILLEAPEDATSALEYLLHPGLEPPVAILVYDEKNLRNAAFLPFAGFSPEWQAAQFGFAAGSTVRLMDLPMSIQFQLGQEANQPALPHPPELDPMGHVARIAGYSDSERWWEATFEQAKNPASVFEVIIDLNTALRQEFEQQQSKRTLLREAYMRQCIRKSIKDGFQQIAVVCGAWHSPALHYLDRYTATKDQAMLKGLKKCKTKATWIPWSYPQMTFESGYRSGVISPAWYELLFENRADATAIWMSKAVSLLREDGMEASVAHAVEATRLAHTLGAIREQPIPGLPEMKEAAIAVFCGGHSEPWQLIESKLVVGDKVGKVPDDIPLTSLQQDMEARIRKARFTKVYQSPEVVEKELDLRKPGHLDMSHLIHQLRILEIYWGRPREGTGKELGSFHEYWYLYWDSEYTLQLIAAGVWGNTVKKAAEKKLLADADGEDNMELLVQLASAALLGGMPEVFVPLSLRLQDVAALTIDVLNLMSALPVLVEIQRYGDTRNTDTQSIEALIRQFIPRISIGLPASVLNIDFDLAKSWFEVIIKNNHAIGILANEEYEREWNGALLKLMDQASANSLLRGLATRILLDKNILTDNLAATQMHYALSDGSTSAQEEAHWLEGFLYGSGLLLLHHSTLWNILDHWVQTIAEAAFPDILPLLRRAFSNFTQPERAKLLEKARKGASHSSTISTTPAFSQQRARVVLPVLQRLLGLEN